MQHKLRYIPLMATVAVLLAAAALRLHHIQRQSLWFDEGWSAYAAQRPTLTDTLTADLTNPPLYYLILHAAVRLFGSSEYALRWVSFAFGLLTIALTYRLADAYFGRRAAFLSALLVTLSPLAWWAAQEARMYTLLSTLVLISALVWHRLLKHPTPLTWIILWSAELALLYAHNTGPIAALWLNAAAALAWVSRRSLNRPPWQLWLGGQVAVFVLWLPWFDQFRSLGEANAAVQSGPSLTLGFLFEAWQAVTLGVWSLVNTHTELGLLALLALVSAAMCIPWRKSAGRWLAAHFVVLAGGIILGLIILGNEFHARYLVLAAPLLLAAVGGGMARLNGWQIAAALAPFALLFPLVFAFAQDPIYQHDDVRGMVDHYAETLDPADTVLAWSYADRYDLAYYWDRLDVRARRTTLPEGAPLEAVLPLLPRQGVRELNVWYTQRADYRGMMSCVLAHGTRSMPRTFTTYGMTSLRFDEASLNLPETIEHVIAFGAAATPLVELQSHARIPPASASHMLCLPLRVRMLASSGSPLKAALIARNTLGWEVARTDAIFATSDQRTSDMLSPEMAVPLEAFPVLALPYGAAPGDYAIYLRLYDEAMASGYEPLTNGMETSGRDVRLGTWRAGGDASWLDVTRPVPLPVERGLRLDDSLALEATDFDASEETVRNGDTLRLSVLWHGTAALPMLYLMDEAGRWTVEISPSVEEVNGIVLDWRTARVPLDAASGRASLQLPDGTILKRYSIENIPAQMTQPPFENATAASFPGIGRLVGWTSAEQGFDLTASPVVTLVWQAGDSPPQRDYTVFVQLVNESDQVVAQSDSFPAEGQRPTSGWRPGEYVTDAHALTFNGTPPGRSLRLIAGWYDATTNRRIPLADGHDFVTLGQFPVGG